MNRLHDWQLRMEAFVRERQSMPFAWGSNDCCTFAASAVEAITGERVCGDLRDYDTALGAQRVLQASGGVRGLATLAFGEPVPVAQARIGDVVALKVSPDQDEALGVCNGTTVLAAGPVGMVVVGMDAATAAWRVG